MVCKRFVSEKEETIGFLESGMDSYWLCAGSKCLIGFNGTLQWYNDSLLQFSPPFFDIMCDGQKSHFYKQSKNRLNSLLDLI